MKFYSIEDFEIQDFQNKTIRTRRYNGSIWNLICTWAVYN